MKKNVLIAIHDLEVGGIERSLVNMLQVFDYDRYNVDLMINEHKGDFLPLLPKEVRLLPPVAAYGVFRRPIAACLKEGHVLTSAIRLLCKGLASLKTWTQHLEEGTGYHQMQLVFRYCKFFLPRLEGPYDVAISYAWPHDFVASRVAAERKLAWIHTDYSKLEIDHRFDLKVWQRFDAIASVSDECTEAFIRTYPSLRDKVMKIENITSPALVKAMADGPCEQVGEKEDRERETHLLSVGRLSYVKGFDLAVESLRRLHERGYTGLKWFVVGYGGYERELRQKIAEHGLEHSFILLGKKSNPYPYMKKCDLFVQPSRYEGKAVTVTEAQILGKPVLITNYPTARSQVEDGVDGKICELSVDGLADGIEEMVRGEELRARLSNQLHQRDFSNGYELLKLYAFIDQTMQTEEQEWLAPANVR